MRGSVVVFILLSHLEIAPGGIDLFDCSFRIRYCRVLLCSCCIVLSGYLENALGKIDFFDCFFEMHYRGVLLWFQLNIPFYSLTFRLLFKRFL